MSLSTVRGPEVAAGRNVEKQARHVAGLAAQLHHTAAVQQAEGAKVESRDVSPDTRAIMRSKVAGADPVEMLRVTSDATGIDNTDPDSSDAPRHSRSSSKPAVEVSLDSCPSFAEQMPRRTKPLWLERHQTLKTVHLQTVEGLPSPGSTQTPSPPAPTPGPFIPYEETAAWLPSWEVARSNLWLLVESALLQAQAHIQAPSSIPAQGASAALPGHTSAPELGAGPAPRAPAASLTTLAGPSSSAPSREPSLESAPAAGAPPTDPSQQPQPQPAQQAPQPLQPAAAPTGPLSRATPFAARPTQLQVAQQQAWAPGPLPAAASVAVQSAPARAPDAAAASAAAPEADAAPPARRSVATLRHSCSVAVRAVPPLPAGLGPKPLALAPTLLAAESSVSSVRSALSDLTMLLPGQRTAALRAAGATACSRFRPAEPPSSSSACTSSAALAACPPPPREPGSEGAAAAPTQEGVQERGAQRPQEPQEPQQPQQQQQESGNLNVHKHHHVAFAAGVAAGTSAAATVSHALHAAAAGVAGGLSAAAGGVAAVMGDPHGAAVATAVGLGANAMQAGATFLMNKAQSTAIAKSTFTAAEAVLGPAAPESLRATLRKRLRATLAGASLMWFLFNLHAMSDTLAHLDFDHDFVTSTRVIMNLATSGPSVLENCRELMQIGVAVSLGVANRNSKGAGAGAALDEALSFVTSGGSFVSGGGDGSGSGEVSGMRMQPLYVTASAEGRF